MGCLLFSKSYGQLSPADKKIMDSLLQNDEMIKMINNIGKPMSYFRINAGVGDKLTGSQDKAVESLQNNSQLIISPSIGYSHKSGFGISATAYLFNENNKTGFYQYTISPSYSYTRGNVADVTLYYTRYIVTNKYSTSASPIKNEFYASLNFKKPWIKPSISAGYSTGNYNEIVTIDTTVKISNQQFHIKYTDSTSTKISSFSFAAGLAHSFLFYNLFSMKDGLAFTPQLALITGINNYVTSHTSTLANYNSFTKRQLKRIRHFQSEANNNNKFELQSLGLDVDVNYAIGKFYVEPEFYVDYYLPQSPGNKFAEVFNINIGITF